MTGADYGVLALSALTAVLSAAVLTLSAKLTSLRRAVAEAARRAAADEGRRKVCPSCPLYAHPGACRLRRNGAAVPLAQVEDCPLRRWGVAPEV